MQIALLVDYDNLMGFTVKGEDVCRIYSHVEAVTYLENHYGPVVCSKVYGDWTGPRTRRTITDLMKSGGEMQYVPHGAGSVGRIAGFTAASMGIAALDLLRVNPNIGAFCFGTTDLALMPFVTRLRTLGKQVFVLGPDAAASAALARLADVFISLTESGMRTKSPNAMDKSHILYALKNILANGEVPLTDVEATLTSQIPDFNVGDFACDNFEEFLRSIANTTVRITRGENGTMISLGNCHNASAYSDEELASFDLAQYMMATRWHITDGDIRDKVLHNIYVIFSDGKTHEMTNEDLRNTVDPQHVVDDRPWQGTIWSLIFGACLWENPKTTSQPQPKRLLSLFRTVTSEDEFLVRYYTSLFKKAYEDRPNLTPLACAELMHPDNVKGALPLFERVFQNLKSPVQPKLPPSMASAAANANKE